MFRSIFFFLISACLTLGNAPQIEARLDCQSLVVQEETILTVTVKNLPALSWPTAPVASPLSLRQLRHSNMFVNGRVSKSFSYLLSGLKPGTFRIPPFRIGSHQSNELTVSIYPKETLTPSKITIEETEYPVFVGFFLETETPYLGQTQAVEAKLYLPETLRIENSYFIDFEKGNFAAWRFDPQERGDGQIRMEGQRFQSLSFASTLTPLKGGEQIFGPGTASPLVNFQVQRRGRIFWQRAQPQITFPALSIKVRPLPVPAPPGFSGAVGNFNLTAKALATEVAVGDPLTVELTVSGVGNLDQLSAPVLEDATEAFKQFEITKKTQGSERRQVTGRVQFSQLIRPQKVAQAIPSYKLSFFDPLLEEYRTALSPALPISILAGEAANPPVGASQSRYLPVGNKLIPLISPALPSWLWQLIPALLSFWLLSLKILPHFRSRVKQTQRQKEFHAELKKVLEVSERSEFYRRAVRLIERWPEHADQEAFRKVIMLRDEICFSPSHEKEAILPKEKNELKILLRSLLPIVLFSCCLLTARGENWRQVVKQKPTPEAFYNLALVEKEAGNLSAAALYLYRYHAFGGNDNELKLTLSQTGAYRLRTAMGMEHLAVLPRVFYEQAGYASLWCFFLVFLARVNRKRGWLGLLIPIGILSATVWGLAWKYYPDEVSFRPLSELSLLMEESPLQSSPNIGAQALREIPAASVGLIHGTSEDWSLMEFPGGFKGWVPSRLTAPIQGRNVWDHPSAQKD